MVEITDLSTNKMNETYSPLSIHPSDSHGATLVPVPFDGIGYLS